MQREMEEKRRMDMEEAERRKFKAQPILNEYEHDNKNVFTYRFYCL